MKRTIKLIEKASIDWNNYLTPEEVKRFKAKDDKIEAAGEIIYDKAFKDRFEEFKKSGWTDEQLIDDLFSFDLNKHLNLNEISNTYITLYHNTSNENAIKINKEGIIPGKRLEVYGKGSEAEGSGIWCSTTRGYGYGGATITFKINLNDEYLKAQNDTEYMVFRKIEPKEILDIDLVISSISAVDSHNLVESDIPKAIDKYGKEKFLNVMSKYSNKFVEPYNTNQLQYLIETGEKYCKGAINLTEGVHLFAFVRDEDGNNKIIEDNDYPDKKSFENDLRANGYTVRRINTDRDMFIMDNSDYRSENEVITRIKRIERDIKNGIALPSQKIELSNLKALLSKLS